MLLHRDVQFLAAVADVQANAEALFVPPMKKQAASDMEFVLALLSVCFDFLMTNNAPLREAVMGLYKVRECVWYTFLKTLGRNWCCFKG